MTRTIPHRVRAAKRRQMADYYAAGMSARTIARIFDVSIPQVHAAKREWCVANQTKIGRPRKERSDG